MFEFSVNCISVAEWKYGENCVLDLLTQFHENPDLKFIWNQNPDPTSKQDQKFIISSFGLTQVTRQVSSKSEFSF